MCSNANFADKLLSGTGKAAFTNSTDDFAGQCAAAGEDALQRPDECA
jgi:hypothetical protein